MRPYNALSAIQTVRPIYLRGFCDKNHEIVPLSDSFFLLASVSVYFVVSVAKRISPRDVHRGPHLICVLECVLILSLFCHMDPACFCSFH